MTFTGYKNPASFPKVNTITNDLYQIGIRNPDTNPEDVLILAQATPTGSGQHIIVDVGDVIYPTRGRLKFNSTRFPILDNVGQDQTEVGFDMSNIMLDTYWDLDGDTYIDRNRGGTGADTDGLEGVLFFELGGGSTAIKYNNAGVAPPTVTDDDTQGYVVGSRWIFNNQEYVATSVATGAAQWQSTTVATGSRHVIQADGTAQPARTNLNFVGSGFTVTDDVGNDATKVELMGADMLKSVYDTDNNAAIDLEAGGTNIDLTTFDPGFVTHDGVTGGSLKYNLTAVAPPAVTDDSSANYGIGSLWILPSATDPAQTIYFCANPAAGAANWLAIEPQIRIRDSGGVQQTRRGNLQLLSSDSSVTITPTDNAGTDTTELDLSVSAPNVDYVINPADTTLAIRDSDHGKTILLQGTHDVNLPSSLTATVRDGFQCVLQLATAGGTITFLPEDGSAVVNGTSNTLSTQHGGVWVWHRTDGIWSILGLLD